MRAVKASGSKIERSLASALWCQGIRYRKTDKQVTGKPDLSIRKYKIAVFVDGEFWHGKDWAKRKEDHKTNREFWHKKIERNIQRDKEVNKALKREGWKVLRFWGKDIKENLPTCVNSVVESINETKDRSEHEAKRQKKSLRPS
jgi:DNA mismatch endonuclease Vsr